MNCLTVSSTEELVKLTDCHIPCIYNTFDSVARKDIAYKSERSEDKSKLFFNFRFSTVSIKVNEDYEHYPFSSFLAEVGGALGLFLGFSFMTCWDLLHLAILKLIEYKRS